MKQFRVFLLFVSVLAVFGVGIFIGFKAAAANLKAKVLSGPYSDDYTPALTAITAAKAKLQSGDTNVINDLNTVETHLQKAQVWARKFISEQDENGAEK